MVRAVVPPTVPEGTERVRVCLHAGNSVEQIQALVRSLESWALARTSKDNAWRKTGQATEKNMVRARL
jgi:8-amino-7-oxononanoate synthase